MTWYAPVKAKMTLRAIAAVGVLVFGAAFLSVCANSKAFENSALAFAQHRVERTLLKPDDAARIENFVEAFLSREIPQEEIDEAREALIAHFRALTVAALAPNCADDCWPGPTVRAISVLGMFTDIEDVARIEQAKEKLFEISHGRHSDIVEHLRSDAMNFFGINAALFLLILVISLLKSRTVKLLFLPMMPLIGALAMTLLITVFGTNWYYGLLYNNIFGYWYLIYLGVSLGFLIDIAFFRGWVTQMIFALVGGVLSSSG
jgi:hypothetical protein